MTQWGTHERVATDRDYQVTFWWPLEYSWAIQLECHGYKNQVDLIHIQDNLQVTMF